MPKVGSCYSRTSSKKTIDLSGTEIGDSLCMFGLRLAKTPPKDIFDGADWVQDNDNDKCKGLQSSMITEAWTGAYMYFGAPWKRTATFADYLSDSKKPAMKHGPKSTSTKIWKLSAATKTMN